MNIWERIFGPCRGCIARDYTIAILKEELLRKEAKIQEVEMRNDNLNLDIRHRLDYVTGLNRVATQPTGELHSIQRRGGIQDRIKRAENSEKNPALNEQRKIEYEKRINQLMNPEIEVLDSETKDAV